MESELDRIEYQQLQLVIPKISTRSCLYQLQPIDTGKVPTENLTSFISRLAESHGVSTGSLISQVIAASIQKKYLLDGQSRGLHKIYSRTSAINGTGLIASDWVNAIESLTLVSQLHRLTLLNFTNVFPSRALLRQKRTWCPLCYEEWFSQEQTVYEPLVWVVDAVKICHKHLFPLVTICPNCKRQMPWLDWSSRPGCCSKCKQWLGSHLEDESKSELKEDEIKYETWVANNVASLVTSILQKPPKQVVSNSLSRCIELMTEGNAAEFARMLHLPKNTICLWKTGRNLPPLDKLLRICYLIQIPLIDFLDSEIPSEKPFKSLNLPVKSYGNSKPPRFFNLNKVVSLLKEELLSHKCPPQSAKEVANRLGYDVRLLREHCPEMCSAISRKYACYRRACRLRRVGSLCKEIQSAAFNLHNEGTYPTRAKVAVHLTKPGCFRELAARDALRAAHHILGLGRIED